MECREDPGRGDEAAVAGHLDHVFAGVAVGAWEDGVEPAVDGLAGGIAKGREQGDTRSVGSEVLDDSRSDLEGAIAAHADHGERRSTGRRGEGSDGVG